MTEKNYFVYKLIPPRPSFAIDHTDTEAAVMAEHIAYWTALRDQGTAVAFGPVLDPAGAWGLAVVEADGDDQVDRIRADNPAVRTNTATVEVYPMPGAVVRTPTTRSA